jgi:hypothetical protein
MELRKARRRVQRNLRLENTPVSATVAARRKGLLIITFFEQLTAYGPSFAERQPPSQSSNLQLLINNAGKRRFSRS